jgi:pyridoxine kinase
MKKVNNIDIKRVAVASDLSCFGKCSLTVALPLISREGIECVPLPSAILSTHTGGFEGFEFFDMSEQMEKILSHWERLGIKFNTVYTGYLCGTRQIDFVKAFADRFKNDGALLLVDPVMADDGELYSGFGHGFVGSMRTLCAMADVITPNATEAAMIAGFEPNDVIFGSRAKECLCALRELCSGSVVITGIRREGSIGYMCYDKSTDGVFEIFYPELDRIMPGCGDVFASSLCARLTAGDGFESSVRFAADFTSRCIRETDSDTHWYGLEFEKVLKMAEN